MNDKSLLGSKTFWLNILGVAATVLGSGLVPMKYSVPALGVLNIVNRVVGTNSAVTSVLPQ